VHLECHLAEIRVDPSAVANLNFFAGQPHLGFRLRREGLRRGPELPVRPQVTGLKPARRQPPHPAEAPLSAHQATLPRPPGRAGSTSPASMNCWTADTGIRTWRPTRMK